MVAALLPHIQRIQKFITSSHSLAFGAGVDINNHSLALGVSGTGRRAGAVWVSSVDKVRKEVLHNFRYFVIIRRPGKDFIQIQISHGVFNLSRVNSAARSRSRGRGRTWAGVEVIVSWLAAGFSRKVDPLPGAIADEAIAGQILGRVHYASFR